MKRTSTTEDRSGWRFRAVSQGGPIRRSIAVRRAPARALLTLALVALSTGCHAARESGRRARTVVLISIDTLRADHLRLYGGVVAAPHIEALAADGVVYRAAFSHSPQTLPSHASLLTGLLPFEHGARDNVGFTLNRDVVSLAERVRRAGYATGAAVSSYILRKETGIDRGFDEYDAAFDAPAGPEVTIGQVQRPGADTVRRANDWITRHDRGPLFFFLHLYEPHTPYTPPSPYREQYHHPYDGEIAYADSLVGGTIELLKSRGLYQQALIVLTSDHGEGLGDHDEQEHGIFLYQSVAHVPLIVKWPDRARSGTQVSAAIQLIDVAPTIAALTGAQPDTAWRGASLFDDPDRPGARARSIYSESMYPRYHFGWSELYALTDGRFRYIQAPRDELYDLDRDAAESDNLAAARRQTRDAMRAALTPFIQPAPASKPQAVAADDLEKFQALGYIGMSVQPAAAVNQLLPDPKDKIGVFRTYRQAIQFARDGRFDEAIAAYKRILADNPQMLDVWERLATVLQRTDHRDEAILVMRRIISLAPDNAAAHLRLGRALARKRQYDQAEAEARAAIDKDPGQANELLARIAYERGSADAAASYAEAAIARDPGLAMPFYIQGLVRYERREYGAALPLFEEAAAKVTARPGLTVPGLYLHLGDCLFRAHRNDEAERAFANELKLYPESLEARMRLGAFYLATGRKSNFVDLFTDLVAQAPTAANYDLAIRALKDAGEDEQARALEQRGRTERNGGDERTGERRSRRER
jgi:choline-sulfatase